MLTNWPHITRRRRRTNRISFGEDASRPRSNGIDRGVPTPIEYASIVGKCGIGGNQKNARFLTRTCAGSCFATEYLPVGQTLPRLGCRWRTRTLCVDNLSPTLTKMLTLTATHKVSHIHPAKRIPIDARVNKDLFLSIGSSSLQRIHRVHTCIVRKVFRACAWNVRYGSAALLRRFLLLPPSFAWFGPCPHPPVPPFAWRPPIESRPSLAHPHGPEEP
jgi:hypothetical protein